MPVIYTYDTVNVVRNNNYTINSDKEIADS